MTVPNTDNPLITAARTWYDAGYCVVPTNEDGGKRPFGLWKEYQEERPEWQIVEKWLTSGKYTGIGVLCGASSENAEMLEIEGPLEAAVARLTKVIDKSRDYAEIGMPELLAEVARGCVEQSAGGGLHFFIRVSDGPALKNTKLAFIPAPDEEEGKKVVAETRGAKGFVVVAPTTARQGHRPGASYMFINGGHPDKTVTVTSEERDLLHLLFKLALNEVEIAPEKPKPEPKSEPSQYEGESAFDAYRKKPWAEILGEAGWTYSHTFGGDDYWVRPGKDKSEGHAAVTHGEDEPFVNFSSNAPMPTEEGLSKGQFYAYAYHGGDMSAAARALADEGYGEQTPIYPALAEFLLPEGSEQIKGEQVFNQQEWIDLNQSAIMRRVNELKIAEEAKTILQRLKMGEGEPLEGIFMHEFLQQDDEEEQYRVHGMWPAEGRVLLAAAAKSGKTTMMIGNLIPCLVDGSPFLGKFPTTPVEGNVVLLNMEVGERTLRGWAAKAGVAASDKVFLVNLRGKAGALQLATPEGRARLAKFLASVNAEVVILDPLAPVLASLGLDENDNSQVAQFFSWWSEALAMAGVKDDVVVHHTGHAGERSRGASRLLDEPDAIWTLTRHGAEDAHQEDSPFTPVDQRYLSAYGRDVELAESALGFDPFTGALTIVGGNRATYAQQHRNQALRIAIFEYVSEHPGCGVREITGSVRARASDIKDTLAAMREDGTLDVTMIGQRMVHTIPFRPLSEEFNNLPEGDGK